jgi:hypothetical protein
MAANLWQWTNNTITGTNEPNSGAGGFGWHQFSAITNWGSMSQATVGPANSTWNSSQDVGEINSEGQTDPTVYGFIRGNNWYNGSGPGMEMLLLLNLPNGAIPQIGFRCAR